MYQTALLLLTGPLRIVVESIGRYLNCASETVSKRLYVKLEPEFNRPFTKSDPVSLGRLSAVVPIVYNTASTLCKCLDVRILLTQNKHSRLDCNKPPDFDVILTNSDADEQNIKSYVELNFEYKRCDIIKIADVSIPDCKESPVSEFKTFRTVCLGGTFDRLHNGHKVLLSEAILKATDKLIVGVSDVVMLQKKVLWELIEPIENRIEEVSSFLMEVDPSLQYEVVPIYDPYGPTIINPDMDSLVVTTETKVGGDKVNIERVKKGMSELHLCVVDLVKNVDHTPDEEEKVSSSTRRMQLLGTPLKSEAVLGSGELFCALLRGHLASDKTSISSRFQASGVPVLCCDEILQAILNKNKHLEEEFAGAFPNDSLNGNGFENFEMLKVLCLKNKDIKSWLAKSTHEKVKAALLQVLGVYAEQGAHTIIVKDSTLFEGYELEIDVTEIWAAILPPVETLKNLKEQFNLIEEEAANLMKLLPSNEKYVGVANIVFSNKWSIETTQEQVNRTLSYLKSLRTKQN